MRQYNTILLVLLLTIANTFASAQSNAELFLHGFSAQQNGNVEDAVQYYEKTLEQYPTDAAAMYYLAEIYASNKELGRAQKLITEAIEISPRNEWYRGLQIDITLASGDVENSINQLQQLIALYPNKIDYQNHLVQLYLTNAQYQEAIKTLNEIQRQTKVSEEVSLKKIQLYREIGKTKKAFHEAEELVKTNPENIRSREILAELYMQEGEKEKALKQYLKIKEIDPYNEYIDMSIADYYRNKGEYETAFEYLLNGFANPRLDVNTKLQIMTFYFEELSTRPQILIAVEKLLNTLQETHPDNPKSLAVYGDFYFQQQQYEKAEKALRRVTEIDGSVFTVWYQLMICDSELNDNVMLEKDSYSALKLFPLNPLPYLFNGMANTFIRNPEKAIKNLEKGVLYVYDMLDMKEQFYQFLGDNYHAVGNLEKCFYYYDKVLQINPNNSFVLNNYAYYLALEERSLEKAEKMALKAVQGDLENTSNQDTYGWVLFKLGKYEEAESWVVRAVEGSPSSEVLEHYGDILFHLGNKEEALIYWKKAKEAQQTPTETTVLLDKKIENNDYYKE